MNIKKINLLDINFEEYTKYNFPYFNKQVRKQKKLNFSIYYNDKEFVKIYKKHNAMGEKLNYFIKNNIDTFKILCPSVTHLIYDDNNLLGYITIRGKDIDLDGKWGLGVKDRNIFFKFLDDHKDVLLNLLHDKKYFYTDLKPKNIIKYKNKEGNYIFSFIDLENFVKVPINYKFVSKYFRMQHWYVNAINKYYVKDKDKYNFLF